MGNAISTKTLAVGALAFTAIAVGYYLYHLPRITPDIVGGLVTFLGQLFYLYLTVKGQTFGKKKVYQYCNKQEMSKQELVKMPYESQEIKQFSVPYWKQIKLSDNQLAQIQELTNLVYDKKVQKYRCPLSKEVMRQPIQTCCCKKIYQKANFRNVIKKQSFCPGCKKKLSLTQEIFKEQFIYQDAIKTFRLAVRKTYKNLPQSAEKLEWKKRIERDFGRDYIEKYL